MNDGLIPRRYAKALFRYAAEQGRDAELYERMRRLSQSFDAQPALAQAMANPFVAPDDKRKLLLTAAGASREANPVLDRFITLLIDNKRIDRARETALAYEDLYRQEHRIHRVTVTSAVPLKEATEKRIKGLVSGQLRGEPMEYATRIDPDLIGGFTVNIDNSRLDASLANELRQVSRHLID